MNFFFVNKPIQFYSVVTYFKVHSLLYLQVTRPVISLDDIDREYYLPTYTFTTVVCISSEGGQGTCYGDSGGPLLTSSADGFQQVAFLNREKHFILRQ